MSTLRRHEPEAPFTKEDFQNALTARVNQAPVEQRPAIAAQFTKANGLIYEPLQSTLSNEPLNTAQGVKDVLGAYQSMGSTDQTVLGAYFTNPERRATVDAMVNLRKQGWADDKIADYMTQVDPKKARDDYQQFRARDVQQIIRDMKVNDASFFGKLLLSDLANGGEASATSTATRYVHRPDGPLFRPPGYREAGTSQTHAAPRL